MPHVYRSKRIYISIVLIVGLALSAVYLPFWRPRTGKLGLILMR